MQGENRYQFSQNMKTMMKNSLPKVRIAALILTLALSSAPNSQAEGFPGAAGAPVAPQPIDPTTGLPVADPSRWKDAEWKDPDKVLAEVSYDGIPVAEVARDLRKKFNDAFDIIVPTLQSPNNAATITDPGNTPIRIQLKNVTASEVFNAMNLVFETENTPMQWELKMNGSRPTVILRVFPGPTFPQEPPKRRIYFVGQLLGDEKNRGMTIEQLVKTISEVYEMSYGKSQGGIANHLQFHKDAQLLVVTGSNDELVFIEQTIAALQQRQRQVPLTGTDSSKSETKPVKEKPKSP